MLEEKSNYAYSVLSRFRKPFRYREKGFTLIELLIVIVILGILAAVVYLNVSGFLDTGTREAGITEKDTVQTAILSAMANAGVGELTEVGGQPASTTPTTYDFTDGAPTISYMVGATETTFNLRTDNPALLIGTIQGAYAVTSNGAVILAKYPAAEPKWHWNPTDGWQPGAPE